LQKARCAPARRLCFRPTLLDGIALRGQEIGVTNKSNSVDRRRAKVTRITGGYGALAEGSVIHATELEP
jgi:hypothetical protein